MKLSIILFILIAVSCSSGEASKSRAMWSKSLPDALFHVNGKNEGYWCLADVHSHRNSARIKIYDASTGKLLQFRQFTVICSSERSNAIWIDSLAKQINYFDGIKFHFKPVAGKDSCWME